MLYLGTGLEFEDVIDLESNNNDMDVWSKTLIKLRSRIENKAFQTWILPLSAIIEGSSIILTSPNEFCTDWLKSRYFSLIYSTVRSIDSSIENIVIKNTGEDGEKEHLLLKIDNDLFQLMMNIYLNEANTDITFEDYFIQAIRNYCLEKEIVYISANEN